MGVTKMMYRATNAQHRIKSWMQSSLFANPMIVTSYRSNYTYCTMECRYYALAYLWISVIRWSDFVTTSSVAEKTGLPDIRALIGDRRLALFGHVRRLPEGAPTHDALQVSVELLAGTTSVPDWRRKPGRPRSRAAWCSQGRTSHCTRGLDSG